MTATYKGLATRSTYTLGGLIAHGGEGAVYSLPSHPAKVAKLYSRGVDQIRSEKLNALIRLNKHQLHTVSAWPEEVIADASGKPVGFVMPTITGGKPLHLFITPSDRLRHAPNAGYADLVGIAANLARAVATFHQAGVVLADINFSNFLVLTDGTVRIIDCDSVQIGSKVKFRSTVAMEEFVPPELQGKRMADVQRTADHDAYGLAVLVFLLLVMGRHPFSGNGALALGQAIAERRHPFGSRHSKTCPFCVLGIQPEEIVSDRIKALFKLAFDGGGFFSATRPSAIEWERALSDFRSTVSVCRANPAHAFASSARECPWCRIEAAGKPPLFVPTVRSRLPKPPRKRSLLGALLGA